MGEADSGVLQKVLQYWLGKSIAISIAILFPPSIAIAIAIFWASIANNPVSLRQDWYSRLLYFQRQMLPLMRWKLLTTALVSTLFTHDKMYD